MTVILGPSTATWFVGFSNIPFPWEDEEDVAGSGTKASALFTYNGESESDAYYLDATRCAAPPVLLLINRPLNGPRTRRVTMLAGARQCSSLYSILKIVATFTVILELAKWRLQM